ncbi:MAG TPA: cation diffusion facilitator family transporter, partial [Phycisphaerae bacterium]|nr:cation diffusion facilitator family transporter [Phycisphaerae bacterium]
MSDIVINNSAENHAGNAHIINKVTWWGLVINVVLSALKMMAGIYGGCQALVADAVHSLSDLATDAAVLIGVKFWSAPADKHHPYGHGRIETLVSLVIGTALFVVAIYIGYEAVVTYKSGEIFRPDWWVFGAAVVSIVSKEWLYRWTVGVGKRIKSTALVANAWH